MGKKVMLNLHKITDITFVREGKNVEAKRKSPTQIEAKPKIPMSCQECVGEKREFIESQERR